MTRARTQSGFTVVEIMVVVAIVGIIAAIAAPNMAEMIRRQRVKTAAFDIFAGLTMARSEAIKRNASVTVQPIAGNWANGFQVLDASLRPLRNQGGWQSLTVAGPAGGVTFNRSGRLTGLVQFGLSVEGAEYPIHSRCITVDLSGRANSKEGTCAS
jgi:type IV fimbrial biogenesis protein FimT